MAGDWIKMEVNLPDKPEVHSIAGMLGLDPDMVVGKLLRVWAWFDQHTEDGNAAGVTLALVDRLTSVAGFGEAMQFAGWLIQKDRTLCVVNFDRHNSESAKKRALSAKRQRKFRNANSNAVVTQAELPREEKRREDKNKDMACRPDSVSEEVWGSFLKVRKAKNAPLTTVAFRGIEREAEKAGLSLESVLTECCSRNWSGFKAKWLDGEPSQSARVDL